MSDQPWVDFLEQITSGLGFEIVYRRRFDNQRGGQPEIIIAAHRTEFLLLCATSTLRGGQELVNGGRIYGYIFFANPEATKEEILALSDCSHGPEKDSTLTFNYSFFIGQGLYQKLVEMRRLFKFTRWRKPLPFLWLVDYIEESDRGAYQRRIDEFLEKAPDWVRAFILGQ